MTIVEQLIKEMHLININDIRRMVNMQDKYINKRIRKIRLIMFLDGYIVPTGYISKKYYKKYFSVPISLKKYDQKTIKYLLNSVFRKS